MANHITTHTSSGQAVFANNVPTDLHTFKIPIGTLSVLYSTHGFPLNISSNEDIEKYTRDRITPPAPPEIAPADGTAVLVMSLEPGASSVMHRTTTLDVVVAMEGEVEAHLDSGEVKRLKTGDSLVQRGTMHSWVNITAGGGWAKLLVFVQAIERIKIGDVVLDAEWKH
jgi:quercetin dioxygenase-like cupin family protein